MILFPARPVAAQNPLKWEHRANDAPCGNAPQARQKKQGKQLFGPEFRAEIDVGGYFTWPKHGSAARVSRSADDGQQTAATAPGITFEGIRRPPSRVPWQAEPANPHRPAALAWGSMGLDGTFPEVRGKSAGTLGSVIPGSGD